ncbi:uncharacterized protein PGTG_21250 [Puccinia graminis f. sp. tritici CRL 75-36-700-3]|uniref:Uncharacterized protein n=1 Tax=Puccinia graminis f. sp. tritici (strain CRL 75-36-700-3 / race SCCL) TaxID=418459 RepID=H6QQU8_PUCGT|nr:uncharacterized protein PGTG_21250 [Puccinia graminis f. sp. tritici CRL 75-36-700-3]EHS62877.1 hypothetical protein PGTG_21250 [Puccinia graminis f. sp. tritici CRL 75-36-700-3]
MPKLPIRHESPEELIQYLKRLIGHDELKLLTHVDKLIHQCTYTFLEGETTKQLPQDTSHPNQRSIGSYLRALPDLLLDGDGLEDSMSVVIDLLFPLTIIAIRINCFILSISRAELPPNQLSSISTARVLLTVVPFISYLAAQARRSTIRSNGFMFALPAAGRHGLALGVWDKRASRYTSWLLARFLP